MRIFLSIDIPDEVKAQLANLEKNLGQYGKNVRFTPVNNLHITVKFLSEQPDFAIGKIKNILAEQIPTTCLFSVHLNKCGVFPNLNNARVLWIGEDNNNFVQFAESVNKNLNIFRMQENKPFCHMTIGRIKKIGKIEILDIIRRCKAFLEEERVIFSVTGVSLYKSELLREGAKYTKIDEFKLKGEVDG